MEQKLDRLFTIKMCDDKNLIITQKVRFYIGEKNVDKISFLIPAFYAKIPLIDKKIVLNCILPNSSEFEHVLIISGKYKDYSVYNFPVDTMLTENIGDIQFWLEVFDSDGNMILKTDDVKIHVFPTSDIDIVIPEEGTNEYDDIKNQLSHLKSDKADNICFDSAANTLQLYAGEKPIGKRVTLNSQSGFNYNVGHGLKVTKGENGAVLSVDTSDQVEKDNTLPITSAGVYTKVGNIEALLHTI